MSKGKISLFFIISILMVGAIAFGAFQLGKNNANNTQTPIPESDGSPVETRTANDQSPSPIPTEQLMITASPVSSMHTPIDSKYIKSILNAYANMYRMNKSVTKDNLNDQDKMGFLYAMLEEGVVLEEYKSIGNNDTLPREKAKSILFDSLGSSLANENSEFYSLITIMDENNYQYHFAEGDARFQLVPITAMDTTKQTIDIEGKLISSGLDSIQIGTFTAQFLRNETSQFKYTLSEIKISESS